MTIVATTLFDTPLASSFGNIHLKTHRVRLSGLPWPAQTIARIKPWLQGHADEPLSVSRIYAGLAGLGAAFVAPVPLTVAGAAAFTVPAGQVVEGDWIAVNWTNPADLVVSFYSDGEAAADRLAANAGTPHHGYLRIGDYAADPSGDGFTAYPGYQSLICRLDVGYDDVAPAPAPEPLIAPLRKLICGLHPLLMDQWRIFVTTGVCAVSGNAPNAYMEFPSDQSLDIRNVGPWGRTTALAAGWWHMWAIRRPDTGEAAMILSQQDLGGPFFAELQALGPAYTQIRKLPAAFRVISPEAGFEEQVLSSWPWPAEWLHQGAGAERLVTYNAANWTVLGIEPLIPTNARFVIMEHIGGTGIVRTPGKGDGGRYREVACSSDGKIEVKGAGSFRVVGWRVVETY